MKSVLDEEWEAIHEQVFIKGISVPHNIGAWNSKERARLSAQAPAMARLLVKLLKTGNETYEEATCWACGGSQVLGAQTTTFRHETDCDLIGILKAAGVVE